MIDLSQLSWVRHFEEISGVSSGFIQSLVDEDDWSFVIKLHAFLEAAATQMLVRYFQEPELASVFSRLELSNTQAGKARFLEEVGMLGKPGRRYIRSLSELRNTLVHEVSNVNFCLEGHVAAMESKKLKTFVGDFAHGTFMVTDDNKLFSRRLQIGEKELSKVRKNPKLFILTGALSLMNSLYDMEGYGRFRQYEKAEETIKAEEADGGLRIARPLGDDFFDLLVKANSNDEQ